MKRGAYIYLVLLAVFVSGCATGEYFAPNTEDEPINATEIVSSDYDDVWSAMIRYTSQSFFSIDNFDKESGLMIVNFSTDTFSDFVDCGEYQKSGGVGGDYEGGYSDYLSIAGNAILSGRANINIIERDSRSEIKVSARYIIDSLPGTWSFETDSYDTINVGAQSVSSNKTRTCKPTGNFERQIIEGVIDEL